MCVCVCVCVCVLQYVQMCIDYSISLFKTRVINFNSLPTVTQDRSRELLCPAVSVRCLLTTTSWMQLTLQPPNVFNVCRL